MDENTGKKRRRRDGITCKITSCTKKKNDKANSWHEIEHKNYRRSLDYQSAPFKVNDRKYILQKSLVTEIEAIQFDQDEQEASEPQFLFDLSQPSIIEDVVQLLYHYLERPEFTAMTDKVHDFIDGFLYVFFDLLLKTVNNNAKSTFIGNTSFYCFFRLFQMAYHRLEVLRDFVDSEQGENVTSFQTLATNLNLTGKSLASKFCKQEERISNIYIIFHIVLQIDFHSGYYHVLLQLIEKLINEDIDQHVFEDCLLHLFHKQAYLLFTMDKLLLSIMKQVNMNNPSC
jgi:histone deacetylase complex regulatory component SIN3